jgi:hypothetical protein
VADCVRQRHQERLLSPRPVKIGEGTIVLVAPLPHERQRLCGINLLNPLVEIRTRIAVHPQPRATWKYSACDHTVIR